MKRKMHRLLKAAFIVAGCLLVIMAGMYAGLVALAGQTETAYRQITPADLAAVADGVYSGKAGGFICSMDLNVTVLDHRISDIAINRQVNGGGKYQAGVMLPRIMQAQTVEVDTVSGATLTSKTILVAVSRALSGGSR